MSGTFNDDGTIDATGRVLVLLGKKRSGKSKLAILWFEQYPGDRLMIDVNGTDGPFGDDIIEIRGTVGDLPDKCPTNYARPGPTTRVSVDDPVHTGRRIDDAEDERAAGGDDRRH